jgi:XTP/dITP diphosphohydrolase
MASLLIATQNPAKLRRYRTLLADYPDLKLLAPSDLALSLDVVESGSRASENARLKAQAYAIASGLPALGIDEALFFPALPPEQQPGVWVRRRGGKAQDDEQLLATFLGLARALPPERRRVMWQFALCLALPESGELYQEEAHWSGTLSEQPTRPYSPGYPLSAILIDDLSGKPVLRMTEQELRERERPLAEALNRLLQSWQRANILR